MGGGVRAEGFYEEIKGYTVQISHIQVLEFCSLNEDVLSCICSTVHKISSWLLISCILS